MTKMSTRTRCHHRDSETQADTQQTSKEYYSIDENGLLTGKVIDSGHKFCAILSSSCVSSTGIPCSS